MNRRLRDRTLRPLHPNVGIEAAYRKRMLRLVDEMARSIERWVLAAYRADPPLAQDELPADTLQKVLRALSRRWLKKFDEAAIALAEYFAKSASKRVDGRLKKILADAGISVKFTMSRAQRDVLKATVTENVSLIKSIPRRYLTEVEGAVMRSIQTGRDLHSLSSELRDHFGVAKRRAALIARDQNNKATSALGHARYDELGIKEAIWMHSTAGKVPRPKHVGFSRGRLGGPRYDVRRGAPIGDKKGSWCKPGELINCRCTSRPVLPL